MRLCNDPMCRKCGTEEETSVHILCECEALASLRHAYLGSFFLDPEDIRELGMEAIWNFAKGTGLVQNMGHTGPVINPLNPELNPICYLLALLAHHFLHVSRIRVKSLTLRLLMSHIYMERLFLMFLDHTQRRSTVGRTPLDE